MFERVAPKMLRCSKGTKFCKLLLSAPLSGLKNAHKTFVSILPPMLCVRFGRSKISCPDLNLKVFCTDKPISLQKVGGTRPLYDTLLR